MHVLRSACATFCAPQRVRASERGAVLILAVYLSSLTLLLLGSVAATRTMTELKAAQRSRDAIQASYLAEAGVDRALAQLKLNALNLTPGLTTYGMPAGTAVMWVTLLHVTLDQNTNVLETIVEVLATGCPTGASCAVAAVTTRSAFLSASSISPVEAIMRTRRNLGGKAIASSQLSLGALGYYALAPIGTTVNGSLHVASGRANAIGIYPDVTVSNPMLVNPADPAADGGWLVLESTDWQDRPAAVFEAGADPNSLTVTASPTPLAYFNQAYPELPPPATCDSTPLLIDPTNVSAVSAEIADGGVRDHDPAAGHVTLCVPYVEMTETITLTLDTATSFYTTSTSSFYPGSSFTNWGIIKTNTLLHSRPDRGLTIIVADGTAPSSAYTGYADGAVYNPSGLVLSGSLPFNSGAPLDINVGYIISNTLYFEGVNATFTTPAAVSEPVTLLSWRQYRPPPPPPPPPGEGEPPPPPGTWAPPSDTAAPPGTPPPGTWAPPGTPPAP